MGSEKRRSLRAGTTNTMRVAYVDEQGRDQFEVVPAQDVSETGCRVTLRFRCVPRAVVSVSLTPAIAGRATVRYQRSTPRGYTTGLEFLGGLRLPPVESLTGTAD